METCGETAAGLFLLYRMLKCESDFQSILLQTPFSGFFGFRRGHHRTPGCLPTSSVPVYLQRNVFIQPVPSMSDRAAIVVGQRFRRDKVRRVLDKHPFLRISISVIFTLRKKIISYLESRTLWPTCSDTYA